MELHVLGIRHHGPGSARSVVQELESLSPDIILVEGPPDADALIPLANHLEMKPPVALLVYQPDAPSKAVYYPFAEYSPEWQAIRFGLSHNIPVRFMDLPLFHRFALEPAQSAPDPDTNTDAPPVSPSNSLPVSPSPTLPLPYSDPLRYIAEASGYSDSERWWEQLVEQRKNSSELFAGVLELMGAVRSEFPDEQDPSENKLEQRREAWMRQTIRAASKEGFERIAIVCGAWHAPALSALPPAKQDAELLKSLPKVKTAATWIPWTCDRLTWWTGYGAGIDSPGYYETLWRHRDNAVVRWIGQATHLLREADLDSSPASSIEAVRLADTLAAMRGRTVPGLPELMEAIRTTLCFGADAPMALIHRKLVVGDRLGEVPDEAPTIPLQQDLIKEQKRLRIAPEAGERVLDLDLRKPNEMDRSRLLHRLNLLKIPWGVIDEAQSNRSTGTFHEVWRIRWKPALAINVIEAGIWGNTVLSAATSFAVKRADEIAELVILTALVESALLADMPDAIGQLLHRLENLAGATGDAAAIMDAVPPLVNAARYGSVRSFDRGILETVINGLVARACIGLPIACASLNDDAAKAMFTRIVRFNHSLESLQQGTLLSEWRGVLTKMALQIGLHGLVAGRCSRILFDSNVWNEQAIERPMGLCLSKANASHIAAAWIDGFLRGSGLLLIHREGLLAAIDSWVKQLKPDEFTELLPIVRRTFATFTQPERRQIGDRIRRGPSAHNQHNDGDVPTINEDRAALVLPTIAKLLGLNYVEEART